MIPHYINITTIESEGEREDVTSNTSLTHYLSVHTDGDCPPSIAAFSAGRPNESHPIGCKTYFHRTNHIQSHFLPHHSMILGYSITYSVKSSVSNVE